MARQLEGPWFRKAKNTWYATLNGKNVSLGVRGEDQRKAAVQAWHRLMSSPPVPKPKPEPKPIAPTVQQLTDAFLADAKSRCKPESMSVYRSALTRFAKRFGSRIAETMKPYEVEAFANRSDWTPSTRNTWLSAIVTAFRWAVRAGMLTAYPLTGLRKPPCGSRGSSAVITPEQFGKLSGAASDAFRLFLNGLWLTGCRPGELAKLTAESVDWNNGFAILTEHKTAHRTGKPRLIILSPEAVAFFREQAVKHPTGALFRNSWRRPWNRFTLQKAMVAAREKAKLPHAICYGLRHTFATDALANGIPDAQVAALLGHSSTTMLHRHYSHLTARTAVLREAAGRVR